MKEGDIMLHELGDKDYCCEYAAHTPNPERDVLLVFNGEQLLFAGTSLPHVAAAPVGTPLRYLFSISGVGFYLAETPLPESADLHYESVRALRRLSPQWLAFGGMTGWHLACWYSENRYCGACATPLAHKDDERALVCPDCGRVYYPNIAVAVIVGIIDGDRIMLSRYAYGTYHNYALIAGYVEIGETLEDAVRREVMEEIGLNVRNIRYYTSQPWGFSRALLVGFFADLDGASGVRIEPRELSEAVWVARSEMPVSDDRISMTARMMEAFRKGEDV